MNRYILVSAFIILILATGCKSSKNIVDTAGVLKSKEREQLLSDILSAQLQYTTLETKGSFKLSRGTSEIKSSAVYKVIKDSVLQISVRPVFGTEFFRMDITPDSIFVIDRMKKQYVAESFSGAELMTKIDFNFYNLQSLLTNQLFYPGNKFVDKGDFKKYEVSKTNDTYLLQTAGNGQLLYNFAIDASDRIASTLVHNLSGDMTIQWSYSDFLKDGNLLYPTSMLAQVGFEKFRFNVEISYDKLDIDKRIKVDRSIPGSYKRVGIMDFVNEYMNKK